MDEQRPQRHSVPVCLSGERNSVPVQPSRSRQSSTTDAVDAPPRPTSSQTDADTRQHARPRRQHRVSKTEQPGFDDGGPQGTSTPSPPHERRELLPTAKTAVTSTAAPPSSRPRSPPGTKSRPVFEPIVADELPPAPIRLPVAHAPQFHFRKPDVISDVNDEVAEPVRPAPRTDRHRQRATVTSQLRHQQGEPPGEPPRPAHSAQQEDSSSPESSDTDDDDDSDDSGEFLLGKRPLEDSPSERKPSSGFRGYHTPRQTLQQDRDRVRSIYWSRVNTLTTTVVILWVQLCARPG